jgi:hypothetical protein
MGKDKRNKRSGELGWEPGATEGGRSPSGVAPGVAGATGPLEPGQRWTLARKREVVLRG